MRQLKVLSLKQFILRQEVLRLYKDMIHACKMIPDKTTSKEMTEWVRADFRKNIGVEEEAAIRMLLSRGKQSLKQLQTSIAITR